VRARTASSALRTGWCRCDSRPKLYMTKPWPVRR
jgi:hypothetical protein